jgi:hypothetical protein
MSLSLRVAGMLYLVNRKGQGKDDTVNEDIQKPGKILVATPGTYRQCVGDRCEKCTIIVAVSGGDFLGLVGE